MAVFWILIAIITFIAASSLLQSLTRKKKRFPPGPKGIPILGHLHMLGQNPHQDLHNIANKHGSIMYLRFGFVPIMVVSSPEAAELFLKTHDLVFASRPPHQAAKYMSWGQKNISFGAYGPYWRNMRKLCTLELLSNLKVNSFQSMRKEELSLFVESLKESSRDNIVVDLSAKVSSLATEMSCRMVFGKKYEVKDIHDRGFKGVIQEAEKYAAIPNLGDYFPFLEVLDLQGLNKKMKALAKVFDDFFERVIDDHITVKVQGQTKDIIDTMMSIMQSGEYSELQFDRPNVKAVMLDMLIASMDTAASTIEWVFSELLKNPRIMRKLQKELEEVVGLERPVQESDLDKLEYLYMVIKETFRLHPPVPLLLPHYAMEDCTIKDYCIPKGSRVLINAYAIGRDPNAWSDPDKFVPERFIGSDIDVRGQHFQLIPFGAGRRGCPGIQLGLIQVRLIVAQLVHCFDWKLPNDMRLEDLDMTEEFGLVVSRTKHLMGVPSYRLHI